MQVIEINIPNLFEHQKKVLRERRRFNVFVAGRRTGKSVLAKNLLLGADEENNGALNGYPVAYLAPTYKMMNEIWRDTRDMISPIIGSKSEQEKWMKLDLGIQTISGNEKDLDGKMRGGGIIDFWSLENANAIRGRAYKRIIIDEAAYVDDLENAWLKVIRPFLSDYKGDAWFLSTSNGKGNYFYDLAKHDWDGIDGWKTWQMPSNTNPVFPKEEFEEAQRTYPRDTFAQEYLAEFVTDGGTSWLSTFDEDKHVVDDLPYLRTFPIYLTFDFNADPVSCIAVQRGTNKFIHFIKEFSGAMQLDELCKIIRSTYPHQILYVTGDASGNRHDVGFSGRNQTYYTIIQEMLGISSRQLHLNKKNLFHNDSRMLCNTMFNIKDRVKISKTGCPKLIEDCQIAELDSGSSVAGRLKKDRGRFKMDLFDAMRYHFQTYDLKYIEKYMRFK